MLASTLITLTSGTHSFSSQQTSNHQLGTINQLTIDQLLDLSLSCIPKIYELFFVFVFLYMMGCGPGLVTVCQIDCYLMLESVSTCKQTRSESETVIYYRQHQLHPNVHHVNRRLKNSSFKGNLNATVFSTEMMYIVHMFIAYIDSFLFLVQRILYVTGRGGWGGGAMKWFILCVHGLQRKKCLNSLYGCLIDILLQKGIKET